MCYSVGNRIQKENKIPVQITNSPSSRRVVTKLFFFFLPCARIIPSYNDAHLFSHRSIGARGANVSNSALHLTLPVDLVPPLEGVEEA